MRVLMTGALILAAWLGVGAYWHTCQIKCLCGGDAVGLVDDGDAPSTTSDANANVPDDSGNANAAIPAGDIAWTAMEGGNPLFSVPASPQMHHNTNSVELPDGALPMLDSIFAYLRDNPDHYVELEGSYNADEDAPSSHPNLGLARVNYIRDRLIEKGVNPDRIVLLSKSVPAGADRTIGVRFAKPEGELADKIDEGISHKTLYARFGQTKFIPDPELKTYAQELKDYLNRHPEQRVKLIGHTDNIGGARANANFGMKRAKKVRDYFVSKGIPADKFNVMSRGEAEPVATNDTKEGRAKNRRIQVLVE